MKSYLYLFALMTVFLLGCRDDNNEGILRADCRPIGNGERVVKSSRYINGSPDFVDSYVYCQDRLESSARTVGLSIQRSNQYTYYGNVVEELEKAHSVVGVEDYNKHLRKFDGHGRIIEDEVLWNVDGNWIDYLRQTYEWGELGLIRSDRFVSPEFTEHHMYWEVDYDEGRMSRIVSYVPGDIGHEPHQIDSLIYSNGELLEHKNYFYNVATDDFRLEQYWLMEYEEGLLVQAEDWQYDYTLEVYQREYTRYYEYNERGSLIYETRVTDNGFGESYEYEYETGDGNYRQQNIFPIGFPFNSFLPTAKEYDCEHKDESAKEL